MGANYSFQGYIGERPDIHRSAQDDAPTTATVATVGTSFGYERRPVEMDGPVAAFAGSNLYRRFVDEFHDGSSIKCQVTSDKQPNQTARSFRFPTYK